MITCLFFIATMVYSQESIQVPLTSTSSLVKLNVSINNGPITVTGVQRNDVKVTYEYLQGSTPKVEQMDNGLKKISGGRASLDINENGNEVRISSDDWTKGVRLNIEVPVTCDLDLNSYNNGMIVVQNVRGDHSIQTFNGGIEAENISGSVSAHTFNGKISVVLDAVNKATPMAFSNYTGGIDLTLPSNIAAKLKLQTKNGEIYTGFDVQLSTEQATGSDAPSKKIVLSKDNWLVAKVNGGGPEIVIQNHYHDIYIRRGN